MWECVCYVVNWYVFQVIYSIPVSNVASFAQDAWVFLFLYKTNIFKVNSKQVLIFLHVSASFLGKSLREIKTLPQSLYHVILRSKLLALDLWPIWGDKYSLRLPLSHGIPVMIHWGKWFSNYKGNLRSRIDMTKQMSMES